MAVSRTQDAKFWKVSEQFRRAPGPWRPGAAEYGFKKRVVVAGQTWTAWFKIHATWEGVFRFRGTIVVRPPNVLTQSGFERLANAGWFAAVEEQVARMGYRGEWWPHRPGWGDFTKNLRGVADVQREALRLEHLDLVTLTESAQARRRGRRKRP